MSATAAQAMAIVTGAFLAGAMASLSFIAVPVFLDTISSAPQLFHAWARMYHYGHIALPTMAVGTLGLWIYSAIKRAQAERPWVRCALAGAATVVMIPFTWLVMTPTNDKLFRLEAAGSELGSVDLASGKELVTSWSSMHLTRAMFPLVGAVLGLFAMSG